jgi:hypothetical protein
VDGWDLLGGVWMGTYESTTITITTTTQHTHTSLTTPKKIAWFPQKKDTAPPFGHRINLPY